MDLAWLMKLGLVKRSEIDQIALVSGGTKTKASHHASNRPKALIRCHLRIGAFSLAPTSTLVVFGGKGGNLMLEIIVCSTTVVETTLRTLKGAEGR